MSIRENYSFTRKACYIAYVTQSIVVNFAPLLFVMFHDTYKISLSEISALISVTFLVQLAVDFLSAKFMNRSGYRKCIVSAHICAAVGLVLLGILPDAVPNPFAGILAACVIYSTGSGLIEVIVSPIVESCPSDNKEAQMSFLHSFYCWGTAFVILVSTAFLGVFGIKSWRIMSFIWAAVPLFNTVLFLLVPIMNETEEKNESGISGLCKSGVFWLFIILMICGGASELAMSQWASAFAESGLGVSKAIGDLAGPCMFAIAMGTGRVVYAKISEYVGIIGYMLGSAVLCCVSYIIASMCPVSQIALAGCALCGASVGIFWPGVFSLAAKNFPNSGTALFALLALGGDLGCTLGPAAVGVMSSILGDNLKKGLFFGIIFPVIFIAGLFLCKKKIINNAK